MIAARVVVGAAGLVVVALTLRSALRTVVIPRAERTILSSLVFGGLRRLYRMRRGGTWEERDRRLAGFPAVALLVLPFLWVVLIIVGFAALFWAADAGVREAFYLSGTSLTTLGSYTRTDAPAEALSIVEATIGLGIVALLISFLPTLYAKFSQREERVAMLEVRAGTPPSPATWLLRAQQIGWLDDDRLDADWPEWERWFLVVEEAHLSYPALNFFRSQTADRSWITAAGVVLDTAALRCSVLDQERSVEAQLCLRAGFLSLGKIADFYGIEHPTDPEPTDPISVRRAEFDEVYDTLMEAGILVRTDRDAAWHDYAGWRVNYDATLLGLCDLVDAPPATWSADRLR